MKIKSLRFKIITMAAMTMLLLFCVMFFISRVILLDGYSRLEIDKTRIQITGASQMLQEQQEQLAAIAKDWAHWDDTYEFAANPNDRYIQSNFADDTFEHLRINAVLISDTSGKMVYQRGFDYASSKDWEIPEALERAIRSGGILTKIPPGGSLSGLMETPSAILFVTATDILPSAGKAQARGILVMARRIDTSILEMVEKVIGARVALRSVSEELKTEEASAFKMLLQGADIFVEQVSENEVHGHSLLKDIGGKSSLALSVLSGRGIYLQGKSSLHMVLWSAGAIGLMLLAFAWFFDKIVLSRLALLSENVIKIGNPESNATRLPEMPGNDELSSLAIYINTMLDKLEKAQNALQSLTDELYAANQKLQDASEGLEKQVAQRTTELTEALLLAKKGQKAKDDFLATISHEIRTPLNGIISAANLQLLSDHIDPENKKLAEIIHRSGDTLLVLINDILDYSKMEAGKLDIDPHPTEIHAEIDHVAELFRPVAEDRKIAFIKNISPDIPSVLLLDGTRLRQIISNLLSNAIKFTHAGSVTLTVTWESESSRLVFSIRDTGIGIPKEGLDKLFKPFSQVDGSTSRKYGGTGLGLVISSRLVGMMGGEMQVESVPDKGSTFSFSIAAKPVAKANEVTTSSPTTASEEPRLRILLAEDNTVNQIVAMKILEKLGQTAEIANNGLEALEKVKNQAYDIILMDMQMPEMDGLEATRAIRSLGLNPRPRIIGLTANAFDSDRLMCLEAGMDGFQTKPLIIDELRKNLFEK